MHVAHKTREPDGQCLEVMQGWSRAVIRRYETWVRLMCELGDGQVVAANITLTLLKYYSVKYETQYF